MKHIVQFNGYTCEVVKTKYVHGNNTALRLVDHETKEPIAVATINPSNDTALRSDEVIIKDYSENSGMLDTLIKGNIVSEPFGYYRVGLVEAPICNLLI